MKQKLFLFKNTQKIRYYVAISTNHKKILQMKNLKGALYRMQSFLLK